ncbi:MAG: sigma-70 family RNA polymerase sigma factor [Chloroflexi bacterium]|nr:sigma-70 family RNA polymerase sigma factor [Chloroflexota bacterium]
MESLSNLVAAAKAGSVPAFGEIFTRFRGMAYASAYGFLRDHELAQDAAQDAFVEAYLKLGALRDAAAFPGWLKTIVRRQCIRSLRKAGPVQVRLEDLEDLRSPDAGPDETVQRDEERRLLLAAMGRLRDGERVILHLFYYRGYSCGEIGSLLGIKVPAVKKRLFDARKSLRSRFADGWGTARLSEARDPGQAMPGLLQRAA